MSVIKEVFENLWTHYADRVSDAKTIELALKTRKDAWVEDHVAFRTFPGAHTGAHVLQKMFELLGFKRCDDYFFEDKQLKAFWMEPPHNDKTLCHEAAPKIFISELILDKFSSDFQNIIKTHAAQVKSNPLPLLKKLLNENNSAEFVTEFSTYLTQKPAWARPVFSDYEILRKQSEYAAWTLVFGSCVNHFTVSVQLMKTFSSLSDLNQFIKDELKIPMNESGGVIKGTAAVGLEQSSTLASVVQVYFQDGFKNLPYAFIEFAFRHPLQDRKSDGVWDSYYQCFVVNNADKIFESTNAR